LRYLYHSIISVDEMKKYLVYRECST
jgi:hypothetical protein